MKTNLFILLTIIFLTDALIAQVNDGFTDGDFSSNPAWTGDAAQYKINPAMQLQLNSGGENSSYLQTALTLFPSMEWDFWVKFAFSPSDNNLSKVYLLSDQPDLKSSLNGYYIKLGESGANDAIELYRQEGTSSALLCRGTSGLLASAFTVRIKVKRSSQGSWSIWVDASGGNDFSLDATASGPSALAGSWMGVVCKYTSSNSTKFYFDDFYAGPEVLDVIPPELMMVTISGESGLDVRFSEEMNLASCEQPGYFTVDHGIGIPITASRDEVDHRLVHLSFASVFHPDIQYSLQVTSVADLAGNLIALTSREFSWHQASAYEVLITEIMCDPDPPVQLNGVEYLEIYNASSHTIDLKDWTLTIGGTVKTLSSTSFQPGSYMLLAHETAVPLLERFGEVMPFTSFTLVNTGTSLILRNPQGRIVHAVYYSMDWYQDDFKREGGWSLEMMDPANPCSEADNWRASMDDSGGTPGRLNSVTESNPDVHSPYLVSVGVPDPMHMELVFNEKMDTSSLVMPASYLIDQNIGEPLNVTVDQMSMKRVRLTLGNTLQKGITYRLQLGEGLSDCSGNAIRNDSLVKIAVPYSIMPGDLIINEILFNPREGCVDFVEIFNRSTQVHDLRELTLANFDTVSGTTSSVLEVTPLSRLIFPGEYFALSIDTSAIKSCYTTANPLGFIQMEGFPSLLNEGGCIALAVRNGTIIDMVPFSEEQQYPLLINMEGVSLERINPEGPSGEITNWHSAAESAGYATPAYQNSQFGKRTDSQEEISLSGEIFSPDNDGYEDNLQISYCFSRPGYNATVSIFSVSGFLVRHLVSNELCGITGSWTWDGIDDHRSKAPIGRYVILVEIFNLEGNVKKIKKVAVLGGKL